MAQVAAYRQTVLTAFQNVEDNLIALRILRAQLKAQNKAASHAKLAVKLVINQYRAGTVNYVSVLTALYILQQTRRNLLQVRMLVCLCPVKLVCLWL